MEEDSLEYLWTVQSGTRVDDIFFLNSFNGFETLVKWSFDLKYAQSFYSSCIYIVMHTVWLLLR